MAPSQLARSLTLVATMTMITADPTLDLIDRWSPNSASSERSHAAHLDTDDLFGGLSHIWNGGDDTDEQYILQKIADEFVDATAITTRHDDLTSAPQRGLGPQIHDDLTSAAQRGLGPQIHDDLTSAAQRGLGPQMLGGPANDQHYDTHSGNYSQDQNHWTRLKSILMNMRGILEREFPSFDSNQTLPFSVLDKVINIGDKIDIIKRLNGLFDNEMMNFISQKWIDISNNIINGSPVLKTIFSATPSDLTNSLMLPILKGIGHLFQNNALKHMQDLDFVSNLMKSSGFHDMEIAEVFSLLDLQDQNTLDNNLLVEGRQYGNTLMEKSGGYGHSSGGYGHGGGYASHGGGGYMMQTIDPFVLLAGLAFATFLAFLLFRLLSQTTGRRRSVPDMSLNLDLSDTPEVMTNFYHFLDTAQKRFETNFTEAEDPVKMFGLSANTMWDSFQADRMEKSCVRRYLCAAVEQPVALDHSETAATLHRIALTALAQLLGEEQGARMVDGIQDHLLKGSPQSCGDLAPHCDDALYSTIVAPKAQAK